MAKSSALAAQVSYRFLPATSVFNKSSSRFKFIAAHSSFTLSNYFFLGLPLGRDPSLRPYSAIRGSLSIDVRATRHVAKNMAAPWNSLAEFRDVALGIPWILVLVSYSRTCRHVSFSLRKTLALMYPFLCWFG